MENIYNIISLVLLFIVYRWVIFFEFFIMPIIEEEVELRNLHGSIKESSIPDSKERLFLGVIIGPIIEEAVFRGPIMMLLGIGIIPAFIGIIISSVLFGIAHFSNQYEYSDGTIIRASSLTIYSSVLGGLSYGLMVIATNSLWPAILLHALWNLSLWLFEYVDRFIGVINIIATIRSIQL